LGIDDNGHNIGLGAEDIAEIKRQLNALGQPTSTEIFEVLGNAKQREKFERAPADIRIENFLNEFFKDTMPNTQTWLPKTSFVCSKHGVSRILSLPEGGDEFHSEYVDSYRVYQGILHNPSTDKRTTAKSFHIVAGGPTVQIDKIELPKIAFANMLKLAFNPPDDMLVLPFSSQQQTKAKLFVSAYFKPTICPNVPGMMSGKNMEIRMFLPGSLVSILDCTESIFGNAGSPFLPINDAAMDPQSWSGYTGCIVFAPQLRKVTKKELGLPNISEATDRQKKDGMCWSNEDELYHDGRPFRAVARTGSGVIVSIVADSYNGYGKKEIKTQMSYAANMYGLCEEEHSGGTLVFPQYNLGDEFNHDKFFDTQSSFKDLLAINAANMDVQEEGYAFDKNYKSIVYLPGNANFCLPELKISWQHHDVQHSILFELGKTYILPDGYQVHLQKPAHENDRWKMIGTRADTTFCYKPSTVSGGGKSEIAKPLADAIIYGPMLVTDYKHDLEAVDTILHRDYSDRFIDKSTMDNRPILSHERTLGSVIKLLSFNTKYTDEYNAWLSTIPAHIRELVFAVKALYKESWGDNWQQYFSVDIINGRYGHELKYKDDKLPEQYVRVGFTADKNWRNFSLRDDFFPAFKLQLADDITSTVTLPGKNVPKFGQEYENLSMKFVHNCEYRLYQRPDEAVVPGYDHETEYEISQPNTFTCNYRPLTRADVRAMMNNRIKFEKYTQPMKDLLTKFVNDPDGPQYVVCPSELRVMPSGEISKNKRYLQNRQDITNHEAVYLSKLSTKLYARLNDIADVKYPVQAILSGRRNNPPENGIRPLSVYNPLHYMDLPELFLEYISSMTGKSPSTTGAGLEGAMTKGPFNCLSFIYDLNNAILSFILCGLHGFLSSAGYVGPHFLVEHDITYILPEIWSRMQPHERDPRFLIEHGYLEKCENFSHDGKNVEFSRLGYRITKKFVKIFAGRVLSSPDSLFEESILRPEQQDMQIFVDSMSNIVESHKNAASIILDSGEIDKAIPPLKALLYIMRDEVYDDMTLASPRFRNMFKRENVVTSEWYRARLLSKQQSDIEHLKNGRKYLQNYIEEHREQEDVSTFETRLNQVDDALIHASSTEYIDQLVGTIGR
ncbi:MAG: hypothetical protein K2L24_01380, partial [Opitutales bacterium]|nr:hypothetical protein [Opitutales bacterium]